MNGKEIKKTRRKLGLTRKEFANALGFPKYIDKTIKQLETGQTTPSSKEIKRIKYLEKQKPAFEPITDSKAKFKLVDLFAGIGGIRIPFQELKGKCVFSSEWNKFAQKTYKFNFGEEPEKKDINIIAEKHLDEIPKHDIVTAGFPCQPFSNAGLKKGFNDKRSNVFDAIEKIIENKRPTVFLLENVPTLETHDNGRTFKIIRDRLTNLNYTFDHNILRAADFGVPQNRRRIFMVGFDKTKLSNPNDFKFDFPLAPEPPTKVKMALQKKVHEKYTISKKLYEGHKRRKREHRKKGNGFGFSAFKPEDEYTNTISKRYYKDGSEALIDQGHNKRPRKLTPRECARLQGFPEKFIIPLSDTQAYQRFGNSVTVPVVRAIAKKIVHTMKKLNLI